MDPERLRQLLVEGQFLFKEGRRFLGAHPSHQFPVFLRALSNSFALGDALERSGQLFDDFVRRVFVHDDRAPTRLGVVVAELLEGRYVGKHGKTFFIEGRQSYEVTVLDEALRVGGVRDEHVGDAGQRIDRAFERARRLGHELHVELGELLNEVRHARVNRAREVGESHAHLPGIGTSEALEFLEGLVGGIFRGNENDRKQRHAANRLEVGGRERPLLHVGLQHHRSERGEVEVGAVLRTLNDLAGRTPHEAVFEEDGALRRLREFLVDHPTQDVVGARFERMKDGDGLGSRRGDGRA